MNLNSDEKYNSEQIAGMLVRYLNSDEESSDCVVEDLLLDEQYRYDVEQILHKHWQDIELNTIDKEYADVLRRNLTQEIKLSIVQPAKRLTLSRILTYAAAAAIIVAVTFMWTITGMTEHVTTPYIAFQEYVSDTTLMPVQVVEPEQEQILANTPVILPKKDEIEQEPEIVQDIQPEPEVEQPVVVMPEPLKMAVHEIPHGQELHLELEDGSNVKLAGGSKLKYKEGFDSDVRMVELSGKAYFNVARHESKPFKIEAKDMVVKVYGTSFDVHAYPHEDESRIRLDKGSVSVVTPSGMEFHLQPGEELIFNHQTGSADIKRISNAPLRGVKQKKKTS